MPTTKTRPVTKRQAEAVLVEVAKWIGKKGYGVPICPEGRAVDYDFLRHTDDGSDCENFTCGPAPTGPEAASKAIGPDLRMDWDWPGRPTPTVLLEGGPEEWAINCSYAVQQAMDAAGVPVFVEPYASYALCIYRT